jgi:hypothetical protein
MADVGRPSLLDDKEFFLKIRELILDGCTYKEVQETLGIPKGTWNRWYYENLDNFQDILMRYKHERILAKAEANVEILLGSEDERVVADMTKFSLETLGKATYSKRSELTGKDGKDLPTPILSTVTNKENGN